MLEVHSTKKFVNLPCGHAQYFDLEPDGSPGNCAAIHGYDRSVEFTFSGNVDVNGWIIPFGELKPIKVFLEYYFDHVTVLPADDKRIGTIPPEMLDRDRNGLLNTLRVLPYGVSMEMSSLFIWEHVNPYIVDLSEGRVYVSRVQSIEHERNTAFVTSDAMTAKTQARTYMQTHGQTFLPQKPGWNYVKPIRKLNDINSFNRGI